MNLIDIVKQLQSTSSKNEKELILSKIEMGSITDLVLRFLFDDNIVTGIKRSKLNKYINTPFNNDEPYGGGYLDLIDYLVEHKTGKEVDIRYIVNSAKLACNTFGKEFEELIYSIVCKDLKLGCGASTYNKAFPNNPVFNYDVMAGKSWDEERAAKLIKSGQVLFMSEKIDGCRGTRDPYKADNIVSRNGKVWKGTHSILDELNRLVGADRVPDGELVYNDKTGNMTSQQIRSMTTSIMNDKNILDKGQAGIIYKIFDIPLKSDFNDENEGESYIDRRHFMESLVGKVEDLELKYIQIIPIEFTVQTIADLEDVPKKLKYIINSGREGLMCISSHQPYKTGKGYQMMKLKNILSADLKIISWNYGKEKTKWEGKFASFNVEFPYVDSKGNVGTYEVSVGTGYSDEFRDEVNKDPDSYVGKIIEILLTEISKNKQGGYSFSYARMVEIRDDKNTIDLEKHSLVDIESELYFKED